MEERRKLLSLKRAHGNPVKENEKKQKENTDRFSFDIDADDLSKYKEGGCPHNTEKNTEWALRNFEAWRIARNHKYPEEQCSSCVLTTANKTELCEWLCKFVSETCKGDGKEYTPRSIYLLLAGLQRHIRKLNPTTDINIFQDIAFKPLKNVCDAVFKQLHSKGIGTETKVTPALSQTEEDKLWETGVINLDSPTGLLRAVFFYNGKNFCLRGGIEHRNLKISQLQRESVMIKGKSMGSYVYCEHGSKNNQGGFASLSLQNKIVRQHESTSLRCHVKILDKYLAVIPPDAKENDVFYLKPVSKLSADPSSPWFTKSPIGKNRLGEMLKEMCRDPGIAGNYTNHSLRAYGATTLFQAGCSEKLLQQRTGHRSLEALRQYERTSQSQLLDVSNVMAGVKSTQQKQIMSSTVTGKSSSMVNTSPTIVLSGCDFL